MKMKLGLLLCAPALMLAACNSGDAKYQVDEEAFKAAVLDYGFYAAPANATYEGTVAMTMAGGQESTTTAKVEVDNGKVHIYSTYNTGDRTETEENYFDNAKVGEATPTFDAYSYYSDTWYKSTLPFTGYKDQTNYLGLVFDGMAYSDFTYDSESHAYKLNESKEVVVNEHSKITYTALSLYLEDSKLVKVEATYTSGEGEYAHTGNISMSASKVGETSVTLPVIPD